MYEEELQKLNALSKIFNDIKNKVILLKLINKAKLEYDKNNLEAGRKVLIEAYLLDKNNPTVIRGLGCIKLYNGKYNIAEKYFKKALKLSEKKEMEYTLLGILYYFKDNLDESIKYFNKAIEINDNYEAAYNGRNQAMLENHLKIADLQEVLIKSEFKKY